MLNVFQKNTVLMKISKNTLSVDWMISVIIHQLHFLFELYRMQLFITIVQEEIIVVLLKMRREDVIYSFKKQSLSTWWKTEETGFFSWKDNENLATFDDNRDCKALFTSTLKLNNNRRSEYNEQNSVIFHFSITQVEKERKSSQLLCIKKTHLNTVKESFPM